MEEGIFPHSRIGFDPNEIEEERRLCYVGITRAKERLYLLHAEERRLFGSLQINPPSRFINDLPEEITQTL
jgi:DNA helicase-2/ATP-dependent DNA helicase PcrA